MKLSGIGDEIQLKKGNEKNKETKPIFRKNIRRHFLKPKNFNEKDSHFFENSQKYFRFFCLFCFCCISSPIPESFIAQLLADHELARLSSKTLRFSSISLQSCTFSRRPSYLGMIYFHYNILELGIMLGLRIVF